MSFLVSGLPIETFAPLFGLGDAALAEHDAVRRTAVAGERFPCRITLEDAPAGQSVLLLNYEHQPAQSPYRSRYAIYVSEAARETRRLADELPSALRGRPIALRAFDANGMLVGMDLVLDDTVAETIERQFADPAARYIHAHNPAAGCFAARIDRA
jgi:hypothetical protein